MNDYLEGKSVSDSTYRRLTFYAEKLNRYYDTQDRISELLTDADEAMQAEEYLRASINADYRFNISSTSLGTNLRRQGDLDGARECYESVLSRYSHDAGALRAMGILELLQGKEYRGLAMCARRLKIIRRNFL